jgi:hypothetical protein
MIHILYWIIAKLLKPRKVQQWSDDVGVSILLGHEFVTMAIYTLFSFFYVMRKNFPVYIVEDGSLTRDDINLFNRLFTVKIESVKTRNRRMKKTLLGHAPALDYRFSYDDPHRLKLDALLLSPFAKTVYLDCDVLFLHKPEEMIEWINSDSDTALYIAHDWRRVGRSSIPDFQHSFRVLLQKYYGFDKCSGLNTGLFCVSSKQVVNLNEFDDVCVFFHQLAYDRLAPSHEDLLTILFAKHPDLVRLLPMEKYLVAPFLVDYDQGYKNAVCIHYCNRSKPHFYRDAVKLALKTQLFQNVT